MTLCFGRIRKWLLALGACAISLAFASAASAAFGPTGPPQPASGVGVSQQACDSPSLPSSTNPANPLDLASTPPASDPLTGASFFVPGPAHGMAAGALAQLLGIDPATLSSSLSWTSFWSAESASPALAAVDQTEAKAMALIASQPEPQRLSEYSGGGGPGAIDGQTQKILCSNMLADPGTVPILETFFIYPSGAYCPSYGQLSSNTGTFRRQVTEFAQGIGRNPAVVMAELDSIGSSACMNPTSVVHAGGHAWTLKGAGSWEYWWAHPVIHGKRTARYHKQFFPNAPHGQTLQLWASDLAYEIAQVQRYAPNTVIYTEGGYSDGNLPLWTAQMLNMVLTQLSADGGSASRLRGFFTNDTHENWSSNEVTWAQAVSNSLSTLTHGAYRAHYVVNSADNGQGPLIPASKVKSGNEVLCNPANRGLGIPDNTNPDSLISGGPGFPAGTPLYIDAFLWVHTPARSTGACSGVVGAEPGGPANSVFWPARAVQLVQYANAQVGPPSAGWPSRPY